MPLIGMEIFFPLIEADRAMYIGGRLGGGKTALAFRLGYELLKRKFVNTLTSNIPNVWQTHCDNWVVDKNSQLNTVCIIDEAGEFMGNPKDAKKYLLGLRKLNVVMIMPSKFEVSAKAARLEIKHEFNWMRVGIPIWQYEWKLRGKADDKGKLFWLNPSEIFGIYSTKSLPLSDGGISESLFNVISEVGDDVQRVYKKGLIQNDIREFAETQEDDPISDLAEYTARLEDVIQEAQVNIGKLSIHKRGSRQRRN